MSARWRATARRLTHQQRLACAALARLFFDLWPALVPPLGDGSIVALGGLLLWLLYAPAEVAQQATDMIAVLGYANHPAAQLGNPRLGPNLADEAMRLGTLFEQVPEVRQPVFRH